MKRAIAALVAGVLLLLASITYSIIGIIKGVQGLEEGISTGGMPAWLGVVGVVLGFVLVTIGATRAFRR